MAWFACLGVLLKQFWGTGRVMCRELCDLYLRRANGYGGGGVQNKIATKKRSLRVGRGVGEGFGPLHT